MDSSKPIIEVKNIGKKYNITHQKGGYLTLRDILTNIITSPFAFFKRKAKQVAGMEIKEDFWALKDVSFEVNKGEVVGIIGGNGAGKSTLLKILSQITPPTTGEIKIHGKVGSLLEVGTGFHPELSGRENIFLNGAILGMTQKEIGEKFDAIVEFAGTEKFLDTPVKYYSSGMYVRLAFSVAAHMEPDILIIDEVLAVGDAEFQKKCLGKMEEVTKKDGRTILFVSHNMGAIKSLCKKCVLLEKGEIKMFGDTQAVLGEYVKRGIKVENFEFLADKKKKVKIRKVTITDSENNVNNSVEIFKPFKVEVELDINEPVKGMHVALICTDIYGSTVFISTDSDLNPEALKERKVGTYSSVFTFPDSRDVALNKGTYFIRISIGVPARESFDQVMNIPLTLISNTDRFESTEVSKRGGVILIEKKWEICTQKK